MNTDQLNADFALPGQLEFIEGKGGLIQARIHNEFCEALVSTYAGQVLGYKPTGEDADLLFVSAAAYYQEGKATKGGVPVCWPWFGPDPEDKGRGGHGFVRNRQWQLVASEALDDGSTRIVLGVDSTDALFAIWPNRFELRVEITAGRALQIALCTRNRNPQPITISQGLHTYFRVGDATRARVLGLEGKNYIDKVDGGAEKVQEGQVAIAGEVDRIYTGVDDDLLLDDPVLGRRIRIAAEGSRSAVVWNPWIETAASMGDLLDEEYLSLLCVETTNAGPDQVTIGPDEEYRLVARYSLERD